MLTPANGLPAPATEGLGELGAHDLPAHVVLPLEAARYDHPVLVGRASGVGDDRLPLGGGAERGLPRNRHVLRPDFGFSAGICRTRFPSLSSRIA